MLRAVGALLAATAPTALAAAAPPAAAPATPAAPAATPAAPGAAPATPAAPTAPAASPATPTTPPAAGTSVRLQGDASVVVAADARGMAGIAGTPYRLSAPLPEGYPMPTPPGMLELKSYPSVRRAELDAGGNARVAMNLAFWPLFNHIKARDIPMTTPVEVDLVADGAGAADETARMAARRWTVSFLYRTTAQGPAGADGRIRVVDTEPVTVLSLGLAGWYSERVSDEALAAIDRWLAEHPQWEATGHPRSLNYSGPGDEPWIEVQRPVRLRAAAPAAAAPPAPGSPAPAPAPASPTPAASAPASPTR